MSNLVVLNYRSLAHSGGTCRRLLSECPKGLIANSSRQPVLGFADGARGRLDRILLMVMIAAAAALGVAAFLAGRS